MLRDRDLRERKLLDELAAGASRPLLQETKDLHACRMRDRLRQRSELVVRIGAIDGSQV